MKNILAKRLQIFAKTKLIFQLQKKFKEKQKQKKKIIKTFFLI